MCDIDLRRTGTGWWLIGTTHVIKHGLTLLINEAGKQLLRISEYESPSKNLGGRVECAKSWHELAAHE